MIFSKISKGITEAFIVSGYSRTARELLLLSDRQLEDNGFSRELLKQGYKGFPWRVESPAPEKVIPSNLTQLKTTNVTETKPIMPQTPKAA